MKMALHYILIVKSSLCVCIGLQPMDKKSEFLDAKFLVLFTIVYKRAPIRKAF